METNQKNQPIWVFILILLFGICFCGILAVVCGSAALFKLDHHKHETRIGYDFSGRNPELSSGDTNAGSHIFIHQYPFTTNGWITGLVYQNDAEPCGMEQQEEIFILVLRPEYGGYRIVYRQEIMVDDLEMKRDGETVITFPQPLLVMRGDLLAHWQPVGQPGGPIPLNLDDSAEDGLTRGKAGFKFDDTTVGSLIQADGFSGQRDYFMQATFREDD